MDGDYAKADSVRYITKKLILKLSGKTDLEDITSLKLTLKNGKIKFIENLDKLKRLQKLSLDGNIIEKVENVSHLRNLRELNIRNNLLNQISQISSLTNLQILRLSHNQLHHLPPSLATNLKQLKIFDVSHNLLNDLGELSGLRNLTNLVEFDVNVNPVIENKHYRSFLIFHLRSLTTLGGVEISDEERLEANERFNIEEVKRLAKLVEQKEKEYDGLARTEESHKKEIEAANADKRQLLEKVEKMNKEIQEANKLLQAKEELLKKKSKKLTNVSQKQFELEQELAFFKIDQKFDALTKDHLNTSASSPNSLDYSSTVEEIPYIGKSLFKVNKRTKMKSIPAPSAIEPSIQTFPRPHFPDHSSIKNTAQKGEYLESTYESNLNKEDKHSHNAEFGIENDEFESSSINNDNYNEEIHNNPHEKDGSDVNSNDRLQPNIQNKQNAMNKIEQTFSKERKYKQSEKQQKKTTIHLVEDTQVEKETKSMAGNRDNDEERLDKRNVTHDESVDCKNLQDKLVNTNDESLNSFDKEMNCNQKDNYRDEESYESEIVDEDEEDEISNEDQAHVLQSLYRKETSEDDEKMSFETNMDGRNMRLADQILDHDSSNYSFSEKEENSRENVHNIMVPSKKKFKIKSKKMRFPVDFNARKRFSMQEFHDMSKSNQRHDFNFNEKSRINQNLSRTLPRSYSFKNLRNNLQPLNHRFLPYYRPLSYPINPLNQNPNFPTQNNFQKPFQAPLFYPPNIHHENQIRSFSSYHFSPLHRRYSNQTSPNFYQHIHSSFPQLHQLPKYSFNPSYSKYGPSNYKKYSKKKDADTQTLFHKDSNDIFKEGNTSLSESNEVVSRSNRGMVEKSQKLLKNEQNYIVNSNENVQLNYEINAVEKKEKDFELENNGNSYDYEDDMTFHTPSSSLDHIYFEKHENTVSNTSRENRSGSTNKTNPTFLPDGNKTKKVEINVEAEKIEKLKTTSENFGKNKTQSIIFDQQPPRASLKKASENFRKHLEENEQPVKELQKEVKNSGEKIAELEKVLQQKLQMTETTNEYYSLNKNDKIKLWKGEEEQEIQEALVNNLELQTKVKGLLEKFKRKLRDKWIGSTKQKDSYLTKKGLSKLMKSGKIDMKKQISIKSKYYKDEADMFKKLNESLKNEIEHLKRDLEKYRKPSRKKNSISDKKIGTERRETLARVTDLTKTLKTLVPDNWEDGAQQLNELKTSCKQLIAVLSSHGNYLEKKGRQTAQISRVSSIEKGVIDEKYLVNNDTSSERTIDKSNSKNNLKEFDYNDGGDGDDENYGSGGEDDDADDDDEDDGGYEDDDEEGEEKKDESEVYSMKKKREVSRHKKQLFLDFSGENKEGDIGGDKEMKKVLDELGGFYEELASFSSLCLSSGRLERCICTLEGLLVSLQYQQQRLSSLLFPGADFEKKEIKNEKKKMDGRIKKTKSHVEKDDKSDKRKFIKSEALNYSVFSDSKNNEPNAGNKDSVGNLSNLKNATNNNAKNRKLLDETYTNLFHNNVDGYVEKKDIKSTERRKDIKKCNYEVTFSGKAHVGGEKKRAETKNRLPRFDEFNQFKNGINENIGTSEIDQSIQRKKLKTLAKKCNGRYTTHKAEQRMLEKINVGFDTSKLLPKFEEKISLEQGFSSNYLCNNDKFPKDFTDGDEEKEHEEEDDDDDDDDNEEFYDEDNDEKDKNNDKNDDKDNDKNDNKEKNKTKNGEKRNFKNMVKPTYKKKITEKGKSKTHITSGNDESRNVTKEETEEFYKYFCNLPHHLSLEKEIENLKEKMKNLNIQNKKLMEKWRKYEDEKVDKKTDENFVENIKTLQNKLSQRHLQSLDLAVEKHKDSLEGIMRKMETMMRDKLNTSMNSTPKQNEQNSSKKTAQEKYVGKNTECPCWILLTQQDQLPRRQQLCHVHLESEKDNEKNLNVSKNIEIHIESLKKEVSLLEKSLLEKDKELFKKAFELEKFVEKLEEHKLEVEKIKFEKKALKFETANEEKQLKMKSNEVETIKNQKVMLEAEIMRLENRKQTIEENIKTCEEKMQNLYKNLTDVSTTSKTIFPSRETNELVEKREELTGLMLLIEKQKEVLNKVNASMQETLRQKGETIERLDAKLRDLEKEKERTEANLGSQHQNLNELKEEFSKVSSSFKKVKEEILEKDGIHEKNTQKNKELEKNIESAKRELLEVEEQLSLKNSEFEKMENKMTNLNVSKESLEKELVEKNIEIQKIELLINEVKKKNIEEKRILTEMKNENDMVKDGLKEAKKYLAKTKEEITMVENKKEKLCEELEFAQKNKNFVEEIVQTKKNEVSSLEKEINNTEEKLRYEKKLLREVESEIEKTKELMREEQNKLNALKERIEAEESKFVSLKKNVTQEEAKMREYTEVSKDTDVQIKRLIKELEGKAEEIENKKEEVTKLNDEINAVKKRISILNEELNKKTDYKMTVDELIDRLKLVETKLWEKEKEFNAIVVELVEGKMKKEEIEKALGLERQRNADEVTHLNEEIGLLQSSHDHQKKVFIEATTKLKNELNQMMREAEQNKKKRDELRESNCFLRAENIELNHKIETCEQWRMGEVALMVEGLAGELRKDVSDNINMAQKQNVFQNAKESTRWIDKQHEIKQNIQKVKELIEKSTPEKPREPSKEDHQLEQQQILKDQLQGAVDKHYILLQQQHNTSLQHIQQIDVQLNKAQQVFSKFKVGEIHDETNKSHEEICIF